MAKTLKRQQILLEDWQVTYAKVIAEKYDISYSEAIRIMLCIAFIQIAKELYPGYKPAVSVKEVVDNILKAPTATRRDKVYGLLSKVYFEARKAVEHRTAQLKEQAS